jgi:hypothetical protein
MFELSLDPNYQFLEIVLVGIIRCSAQFFCGPGIKTEYLKGFGQTTDCSFESTKQSRDEIAKVV